MSSVPLDVFQGLISLHSAAYIAFPHNEEDPGPQSPPENLHWLPVKILALLGSPENLHWLPLKILALLGSHWRKDKFQVLTLIHTQAFSPCDFQMDSAPVT